MVGFHTNLLLLTGYSRRFGSDRLPPAICYSLDNTHLHDSCAPWVAICGSSLEVLIGPVYMQCERISP